MKTYSETVSVVIPFYRGIDWLLEALESVVSQTYKDIEILVVNDGSSEPDERLLERFGDSIRYFKTNNRGPGAARNIGIENSTGDYIAFLDSDDLWLCEKLEKQVALMRETGAVWSHTSYIRFYESDRNRQRKIDVTNFRGVVYPKCLVSSPIATPCVMIRRDFLESNPVIRFSEKMRFGQDTFMWLNISMIADLEVLSEPLTKVRIRGANAGFSARAKFLSKGQIWAFLKHRQSKHQKPINTMVKNAYRYCFVINNLLSALERGVKLKKKVIEIISILLYIFPFFIFRYYLFIYRFKHS